MIFSDLDNLTSRGADVSRFPRRRRNWSGFGSDAVAEAAGAASGFSLSSGNNSTQAIVVGVTSGVLIWVITRVLDRVFKVSRQP